MTFSIIGIQKQTKFSSSAVQISYKVVYIPICLVNIQ